MGADVASSLNAIHFISFIYLFLNSWRQVKLVPFMTRMQDFMFGHGYETVHLISFYILYVY